MPAKRPVRASLTWTVLLALGALLLFVPLPASSAAPGPITPHSSGAAPLAASPSHPASTPTPSANAFGLTIAGQTPTAASLSWTATTDITFSQYTVYSSTNGSSGPWSSAGVVTAQATTEFAASGLVPATHYWWEVVETGLFGTTTSAGVNASQPDLAGLNYTALSSSSIQLNWTNNASYGGLLSFHRYEVWAVQSGAASSQAIVSAVGTHGVVLSGIAPGASILYYLNTTDCANGCTGGSAELLNTTSNPVTYGAPQVLSASVVATRNVVDVNQSDLFTCNANGGASPFNYSWQFGSGRGYAPAASVVSFAFAANGSIQVSCNVTDSLGSSYVASTTVQVDPLPVVDATANRTAVDVDQPIAFQCSASGGTAPFQLTWSLGAGGPISGGDVDGSYPSAGLFAATCIAQDSTGTTATGLVSIDVSPTLDVAVNASAPAVAPGTSVMFTLTATNGSGTYPFLNWTFGDGQTGSGFAPTHSYAVAGEYHVRGSVTDSNGATVSATASVNVSEIVPVLTELTTALPPGGWFNVTATASGGAGGPFNFTWTIQNTTYLYGGPVHYEFLADGAYAVNLTVRDSQGASVEIHVATVNVTTPPGPAPPSPLPEELAVLGAIVLLLLLALVLFVAVRRRRRERAYPSVAGRVPATDPAKTVQGTKICPSCGTANVSTRRTCEACGAALKRTIL